MTKKDKHGVRVGDRFWSCGRGFPGETEFPSLSVAGSEGLRSSSRGVPGLLHYESIELGRWGLLGKHITKADSSQR